MLGLAVLFACFVYFVVLFFATLKTYLTFRRKGKNRLSAVASALLVFLLITVPVFWDWIPTKKAYKRYCATEAGVTQYKTLEQWMLENPGAYENLYHYTYDDREIRELTEKQLSIVRNGKIVNVLPMTTPRFGMYYYWEPLPLGIRKSTTEFIDVKTSELIAKKIEFSAGPGNVLELGGDSYKIWLNERLCGDENYQFSKITYEFRKLEPTYILKSSFEKNEQEQNEMKKKPHWIYFCD